MHGQKNIKFPSLIPHIFDIGSYASAMLNHGARSDGMLRYGATATSSCCLPPILEDQQLFPAARLIDMMIQS